MEQGRKEKISKKATPGQELDVKWVGWHAPVASVVILILASEFVRAGGVLQQAQEGEVGESFGDQRQEDLQIDDLCGVCA
jgi:hypothetical protein